MEADTVKTTADAEKAHRGRIPDRFDTMSIDDLVDEVRQLNAKIAAHLETCPSTELTELGGLRRQRPHLRS